MTLKSWRSPACVPQHACVPVRTSLCVHACACACILMRLCVCSCACAHACTCMCACLHIVRACAFVQACEHAHHAAGVYLVLHTDLLQRPGAEGFPQSAPKVDQRPNRFGTTQFNTCNSHSSSQFELMQAAGKIACLHGPQLDCELSAQATSRPRTPGIDTLSLFE